MIVAGVGLEVEYFLCKYVEITEMIAEFSTKMIAKCSINFETSRFERFFSA
jgi:hypothetical protein